MLLREGMAPDSGAARAASPRNPTRRRAFVAVVAVAAAAVVVSVACSQPQLPLNLAVTSAAAAPHHHHHLRQRSTAQLRPPTARQPPPTTKQSTRAQEPRAPTSCQGSSPQTHPTSGRDAPRPPSRSRSRSRSQLGACCYYYLCVVAAEQELLSRGWRCAICPGSWRGCPGGWVSRPRRRRPQAPGRAPQVAPAGPSQGLLRCPFPRPTWHYRPRRMDAGATRYHRLTQRPQGAAWPIQNTFACLITKPLEWVSKNSVLIIHLLHTAQWPSLRPSTRCWRGALWAEA